MDELENTGSYIIASKLDASLWENGKWHSPLITDPSGPKINILRLSKPAYDHWKIKLK